MCVNNVIQFNPDVLNALNKFRNGVYNAENSFSKYVDSQKIVELDPTKDDIFLAAVNEAYGDAKRTFEGIGGRATAANQKLGNKSPNQKLADNIQNYFKYNTKKNISEREFDELHGKWCTEYRNDLKTVGYSKATYGQAQKVVNMTFKYLYCLNGATTTYNGYFKHCHVALDSFTLEWIVRNCKPSDKLEVWSKLNKVDTKPKRSNYLGYDSIVPLYRSNMPQEFSAITPFQSEFIFWPEIQMHLACEAFYFALDDALTTEKKNDYKEKDLNSKKATIRSHHNLK